MAILLPALIGLVPLFIAPGILFHYDIVPRIVLLALFMAAALLRPREISDGLAALRARASGRWLCLLATVHLIWFAIATALSSRPWFSLLGSNWRRMGLLTLLSLLVFVVLAAGFMSHRPEAIRMGLRAFAVSAIVASIYGIGQYFDIDPFQPVAAYHALNGDSIIVRPPGTLGHADYFAWWLAIAVFCAIALDRPGRGSPFRRGHPADGHAIRDAGCSRRICNAGRVVRGEAARKTYSHRTVMRRGVEHVLHFAGRRADASTRSMVGS